MTALRWRDISLRKGERMILDRVMLIPPPTSGLWIRRQRESMASTNP